MLKVKYEIKLMFIISTQSSISPLLILSVMTFGLTPSTVQPSERLKQFLIQSKNLKLLPCTKHLFNSACKVFGHTFILHNFSNFFNLIKVKISTMFINFFLLSGSWFFLEAYEMCKENSTFSSLIKREEDVLRMEIVAARF